MTTPIQDRATFTRLRHEGQVVRGRYCWIRCVANPRGQAEVAFAIGRPVGSAVRRNHVRRRLRHILASEQRSEQGLGAGAYLVGVHKSIHDASWDQLMADVTRTVRKAEKLIAEKLIAAELTTP